MSRIRRTDEGAELVEYSFTFPILFLTVLFGLFILWAAYLQVAAGQAAREGARYASVALPPLYRTHPDTKAVVDRVKGRVPDLHLTDQDVTVSYPSCPAPCTEPPSNTPIVVTVTKQLPGFFSNFKIKATSAGEVRAE